MLDCPIEQLPNEVLTLVFEEFVAQWEMRDNHMGWSSPIPASSVSHWKDTPEPWMSAWRHDTFAHDFGTVPNYDLRGLNHFLLAITRVSRRWREVALNQSPRIWRNIRHAPHVDIAGEALELSYPFKMCLRRSGTVPLRVSTYGLSCLQEVLEYIAAGDELENISLLRVGGWEEAAELVAYLVTMKLPKIRAFTFPDCGGSSLGSSNIHTLLTHLQHSALLQSLTLQYMMFDHPDALPPPSIRDLSVLKSLEVLCYTVADMAYFFSMLYAPNLERLVVAEYYDPSGYSSRALAGPQGGLASLIEVIFGGGIPLENLLSILRAAPKVQVIGIYDPREGVLDGLIQHLNNICDPNDMLAPELRSLLLDKGIYNDRRCIMGPTPYRRPMFSLDAVRQLVKTRQSSKTAPIQSVGLSEGTLQSNLLQLLAMEVVVFEWTPPRLN